MSCSQPLTYVDWFNHRRLHARSDDFSYTTPPTEAVPTVKPPASPAQRSLARGNALGTLSEPWRLSLLLSLHGLRRIR